MRSIVYRGEGGPDVIATSDVPDPVTGTEDALVAVAFAGLNRADVLERQGRYPRPPDAPPIPGLEFSGIVRAVGAKVRSLATGDRVCGLVPGGAHAELVATHADTLAKVPPSVSLRDAAAIPEAFITAHDALATRGGFALGETVLVHAVGSSVGLAAVALVKRGAASLSERRARRRNSSARRRSDSVRALARLRSTVPAPSPTTAATSNTAVPVTRVEPSGE